MKRAAILLALALALPAAWAQQPPQQASTDADKPPVYVPPQRGAPSRRVGGSSRGAGDNLPSVMVLVPDHVGLTTSDTPALYWYLSKPTAVRIGLLEAMVMNAPASASRLESAKKTFPTFRS